MDTDATKNRGGAIADAGAGAAARTVDPTVEASVFEGMFERALKPDPVFREELKRAGYDHSKMQLRYPVSTWRACLDVARRHVCPELPLDVAYRELGKRFVGGFFTTIIGRFIHAVFPMLGPEALLKRSPKFWRGARADVEIIPIEEGPRRWRVHFRDPNALPEFIAGIFEGAGVRSGDSEGLQVAVENVQDGSFELSVRW